jgi:hypothetical protein
MRALVDKLSRRCAATDDTLGLMSVQDLAIISLMGRARALTTPAGEM